MAQLTIDILITTGKTEPAALIDALGDTDYRFWCSTLTGCRVESAAHNSPFVRLISPYGIDIVDQGTSVSIATTVTKSTISDVAKSCFVLASRLLAIKGAATFEISASLPAIIGVFEAGFQSTCKANIAKVDYKSRFTNLDWSVTRALDWWHGNAPHWLASSITTSIRAKQAAQTIARMPVTLSAPEQEMSKAFQARGEQQISPDSGKNAAFAGTPLDLRSSIARNNTAQEPAVNSRSATSANPTLARLKAKLAENSEATPSPAPAAPTGSPPMDDVPPPAVDPSEYGLSRPPTENWPDDIDPAMERPGFVDQPGDYRPHWADQDPGMSISDSFDEAFSPFPLFLPGPGDTDKPPF